MPLCLVAAWLWPGQALPPPRDGDIRTLYWELQNETEDWLTLEPRSPDGKPAPPGMILTITRRFRGKQPPKTPPADVDVRAYAGFQWAPKVILRLLVDDHEQIDLVPAGMFALATGAVSDYLPATVSVATLKRIGSAKRVTGNALGFDFELTETQRNAIRAFVDRIRSENPGRINR